MKLFPTSLAFGLLVLTASAAVVAPGADSAYAAAQSKTVTLAVQNMSCAACPRAVRASLEAVPGVSKVDVSYEKKTAVVTFDEGKASVADLVSATTNAGYPSSLKQ